MTRLALRLTLVFALAVLFALAGTVSTGNVLFIVANHRVELSFNLFVVLLIIGYGAFHLVLRAVRFALALPARARAERAASERQRAQSALLRAVAALQQGDHGYAERSALDAAKVPELKSSAMVLAGQAAQTAGELGRALQHFEGIKVEDDVIGSAKQVGIAQIHLAANRAELALPVLRDLLARDGAHAKALTLRLRAHTQQQQWTEALAALKELRRARTKPIGELYAIEINLHRKAMAQLLNDPVATSSYWHKLSDDVKRDVSLMIEVIDALLSKGAKGEARAVIESALPSRWDSRLAERYGDTAEGNVLSQIERAERWLLQHPKDTGLLVTLAKLCFAQGLWGKAQSYVDASAALAGQPATQTIQMPGIAEREANRVTGLANVESVIDSDVRDSELEVQQYYAQNTQRIVQTAQHLRAQLRERLVLSTLGT